MITMINTHVWLHKGRHILTCRERKYWWGRFLAGYTVKPIKYDERHALKMGEGPEKVRLDPSRSDILDSEKRSAKW